MSFPDHFVWGAAAASYQIEGAAYEDGKGLSVWDVFSHTDGKTWQGHHGDVACDHYHRYPEDVALMKQISLHAYRLSISYPRVLPNGFGTVNEAGLAFYDKLVDELLGAGIEPYVTLFHWDYPYEAYCKGGWLNRDSTDWFAEYTDAVTKKLGDRVKHWMTHNEPSVFVNNGHFTGRHAPGEQWDNRKLIRIIHHVLLAHGKSAQVIRGNVNDAKVSLAHAHHPLYPLREEPTQIEMVRQAQWTILNADLARWHAALWLDPILKGDYPSEVYDLFPTFPIQDGDLDIIQSDLDWLGLNIYQGVPLDFEAGSQQSSTVTHDENGRPVMLPLPPGSPRTMMDWFVSPPALYWGPKFLFERYNKPIVITENGLASMDWIAVDGAVHDANRIDFLTRYLREFERAGEDGVDIAGYFQWSILDNFEWAEGYRKRFGL
ncbi:MAG: GH1 family beta-glucosidase, partial [Chloroflexota bacterium]